MNKKTLLKSIIGTVGLYPVLVAFIVIFRVIVDFLVHFSILVGAFIACSIAAGLLFKGKIYAWVWTVATVIFHVVIIILISGGIDVESIFTYVWFVVAPLLIPFFVVKPIFVSINLQE